MVGYQGVDVVFGVCLGCWFLMYSNGNLFKYVLKRWNFVMYICRHYCTFVASELSLASHNKWKETGAEGSSRWTSGCNKLMVATDVSWLHVIFRCTWIPNVSDLPIQRSP